MSDFIATEFADLQSSGRPPDLMADLYRGLPHFPCYPNNLATEDALGTRIFWPRWSDNADFDRYRRPSACFRQAARKVRQTLCYYHT